MKTPLPDKLYFEVRSLGRCSHRELTPEEDQMVRAEEKKLDELRQAAIEAVSKLRQALDDNNADPFKKRVFYDEEGHPFHMRNFFLAGTAELI